MEVRTTIDSGVHALLYSRLLGGIGYGAGSALGPAPPVIANPICLQWCALFNATR
jgi:hypothetical protein